MRNNVRALMYFLHIITGVSAIAIALTTGVMVCFVGDIQVLLEARQIFLIAAPLAVWLLVTAFALHKK